MVLGVIILFSITFMYTRIYIYTRACLYDICMNWAYCGGDVITCIRHKNFYHSDAHTASYHQDENSQQKWNYSNNCCQQYLVQFFVDDFICSLYLKGLKIAVSAPVSTAENSCHWAQDAQKEHTDKSGYNNSKKVRWKCPWRRWGTFCGNIKSCFICI